MGKKVVVITGGGIGIGRACAYAFSKAGYHVIVTDVLEKEGRQVADELERGGSSAEFHSLDVRSTQQANTVVADIEKKHGALDVVLANAGIAHKTPLADLSDEKWASTLDVDLNGFFRVVRAAAPAMRKNRKGCIIALSSIMGVAYGWDEHVHYSAAKAGVVGLVRGLAVELARDEIRVNGIAPGPVLWPEGDMDEELKREIIDKTALKRHGTPQDVARTALFLAKDAPYITGQIIAVDGGRSI